MTQDFLTLTRGRYSCRNYVARDIEPEKLNYVMECVRMAPSAVNRQPWMFRVVKDGDTLQKLQQCYNRDWFKSAPMCIVASKLTDQQWVRSDGKPHGDIDVAIAVEHLCLAATEQGLATCWVCNFDVDLCRKAMALPAGEEPVVLIPIGYAADQPTEKKRKAITEISTTI